MIPNVFRTGRAAVRVAAILAAAGLTLASGSGPSRPQEREPRQEQERPEGFELVKATTVTGSAAWTDTGIDVKPGEEYAFQAGGSISLQKNNPVAVCGPDGLALRTTQQPLADRNLGCLIGMVRVKIAVSVDKQSKEQTHRLLGDTFYIGARATVAVPSAGRLLLGINENVTGDNDGQFDVSIFRKIVERPAR
jgi:hypothetical protein